MSVHGAFTRVATVSPVSSGSGEGRLVYGKINDPPQFRMAGNLLAAEGSTYNDNMLAYTIVVTEKDRNINLIKTF